MRKSDVSTEDGICSSACGRRVEGRKSWKKILTENPWIPQLIRRKYEMHSKEIFEISNAFFVADGLCLYSGKCEQLILLATKEKKMISIALAQILGTFISKPHFCFVIYDRFGKNVQLYILTLNHRCWRLTFVQSFSVGTPLHVDWPLLRLPSFVE